MVSRDRQSREVPKRDGYFWHSGTQILPCPLFRDCQSGFSQLDLNHNYTYLLLLYFASKDAVQNGKCLHNGLSSVLTKNLSLHVLEQLSIGMYPFIPTFFLQAWAFGS